MRDRPVLHGQDHWRKFSDALATPWLQVGVGDAPAFESGITGTLLYARDSAGETQVELGALSGWTSGNPVVFLPSSYWDYMTADAVWVGWDTALSAPVAVILSATDGGVRIYEADISGGAVAAGDVTIVDAGGDFTATNVEDALAELQADHETDAAALAAHIADSSDAHDASAISIADAGNDFTATDVEGALAELQSDHETDEAALAAHLADATDAHDASAVSFVPTGALTSTDVQDAIADVYGIVVAATTELPTFQAAGPADDVAADPGDIDLAFPTGLASGDLLIAHLVSRSFGNTLDTIPGGWSLLFGPDTQATTIKHWLYYQVSDGTETGAETWSNSGASLFFGRIYSFRGVTPSSFTEGGSYSGGTGTTITIPSVTTIAANRLGVAFGFVSLDEAIASATGETGGDWTEPVTEYTTTTGLNGTLWLQVADLPSAGSISGGTITIGSAVWGVRSFSLIPSTMTPFDNPLGPILASSIW